MRRMIASLVFAIIGTLGVLAQNGTVTQTFYMDYDTKRIDTCTVAMSFVKGVPTEVSIYFNHEDRKTTWWHSFMETQTCIISIKQ